MKVSVCIPTYNQSMYLEQAIRSAIRQTLPPYEIIISDDNSTDGTFELMQCLKEEFPNIKYIRQKNNLGITKNTDLCMRAASGDFILRLDSDDYLSPNYTEYLVEMLIKYPNAGYAHASVQEIDQYGNYLQQRTLFRASGFQESDHALRAAVKGYRVAANIIIFRKSALIKVNYLTGRPNFGEDYHLVTSISAAGYGNVYHNAILSYYRVWVDAGRKRQKRKLDEIIGLRRVFDEVIEPAYQCRNLSLVGIKQSKANFASRHADCLSWDIYNENEKRLLKSELYRLSSARKVKFSVWLYMNGFGNFMSSFNKVVHSLKKLIKGLYPGIGLKRYRFNII